MRLDVPAIVTDLRTVGLGIAMAGATYLTKFAAAWTIGRIRDYSRDEVLTSWGLSQAQAAATLAAVLVGVEAGVFAEFILSATILMVLLTTLSSPVIVERFGDRIEAADGREPDQPLLDRVLVPVVRDEPPEHEIDLAELLALSGEGKVLVLNLAGQEDELVRRREHLKARFRGEPESEIEMLDRIEDEIPAGVLNAAVEEEASLVVMPWEEAGDGRECLLVQCMDRVLAEAAAPVLAVHLEAPLKGAKRVLITVPSGFEEAAPEGPWLDTLTVLVEALELPIHVLSQTAELDGIRRCLAEEEDEVDVALIAGDLAERARDEAREDDFVIIPALEPGRGPAAWEEQLVESLREKQRISFVVIHAPGDETEDAG
jgi:hypothetical protein